MMPASLLAVHSFGAEHAEECIMLFQSSFARYVMLRCCRGGQCYTTAKVLPVLGVRTRAGLCLTR